MFRQTPSLFESLGRNWQLLLIASLPGSVLRIWAVLSRDRLAAAAGAAGAREQSAMTSLLQWSAEHPVTTLLAFPVLTVAGLLVYDAYRDPSPEAAGRRAAGPPAGAPLSLDRLGPNARELLCAVSIAGEFRIEKRRVAPAVVVPGVPGSATGAGCEFYDDANPEVAQRYRLALAEIEQAGLVEWRGDARLLTTLGWSAARLLNRQELDRIAGKARHLEEPERKLLRLIAACQRRYNVNKVVVRRDGSALSAVYGNGQIVAVEGVTPLAETLPPGPDATAARFEQLVQGVPADYLEPVPAQLSGNPFVVRVTDTGLRYLRHAEVSQHDSAAA